MYNEIKCKKSIISMKKMLIEHCLSTMARDYKISHLFQLAEKVGGKYQENILPLKRENSVCGIIRNKYTQQLPDITFSIDHGPYLNFLC